MQLARAGGLSARPASAKPARWEYGRELKLQPSRTCGGVSGRVMLASFYHVSS
jgi:hypothetical protein